MKCKNCNHENAPLKKVCERCRKVLAGECINNVTGQLGIRNSDGSFTPYQKLEPQKG